MSLCDCDPAEISETGCAADGCSGRECLCADGCDIELFPTRGKCARSLAAESDQAHRDRINTERDLIGLRPL